MNWTVIICTALVCVTAFFCTAMIMGSKYPKQDSTVISPLSEWEI